MFDVSFEKQDKQLTAIVTGSLDAITAPELENQLVDNLDDVEKLILDFAGVDYISSAGIRVLLATEHYLQKRGGNAKLIHVSDRIVKIFKLVGFMNVMEIECD